MNSRFENNLDAPIRYVVGIDLGTTNSVMCYVDLEEINDETSESRASLVHDFAIPQGVAPNVVEARLTLPSFFSRVADVPRLPWQGSDVRDFSTPSRGARAMNDGLCGAVGVIARDYGAANPDAFVSSAKSWLCNANVDRSSKILPLRRRADDASAENSDKDDVSLPKWSPVEISSFYLAHLRAAWNAQFPEFPLETQSVVLTIPASFDETARSLTLEAAKLAKLPRVALVEEPQAAFYAWLERHEKDWSALVKPGDRVLVCDVGGGTTDFALIYALERDFEKEEDKERRQAASPERQSVKFYRVAVGDHLVLGGDNLDLALYARLEKKLVEKRSTPPTPRERALLLRECRDIKEAFLRGDDGPETRRVLLQGSSSKLVGGATSLEVDRKEVEELLVDGFFPRVPLESEPARRRAGLREIALQYAFDPAITKHLAYFLRTRRHAGEDLVRAGVIGRGAVDKALENAKRDVDPARPDAILFNGGAFESPKLRERVIESVAEWFGGESQEWRPAVLENADLYLAAARGAAYYGLVLRGYGEKVGASLARSYYAGVAFDAEQTPKERRETPKGVCILSAQAEPGDEITLPQEFELEVDKPVAFPFYVSSVRTTDAPGDLVALDPNEVRELSPIRTALKTRSKSKKASGRVRARLVARPTEIGTVELYLQEVLPPDADSHARASRWTLQFDARGAVQSDWEPGNVEGEETGVVDESLVEGASTAVVRTFGTDEELENMGLTRLRPGDLVKSVVEAIGVSKNAAPITTLRRLAERTLELAAGRRLGASYEARWLNWLGFTLRPGFGAAADDWRVEQAWKATAGKLVYQTPECRTQYWILWRRIASGLTAGRQLTLAEPLLANVRNLRKLLVDGLGRGSDIDLGSQEGAEIWRLLGALELLPTETRVEIGDLALDVVSKRKTRPVRDAIVWTIGRVGARKLFHGPLDRVAPPSVAQRWTRRFLDDLAKRQDEPTSNELFTLAQLSRRAEDPALDVDRETRETVAAFLLKHGAEESTLAALEKHGRLVDEATKMAFGETLPIGLRWS